MPYSMDDLNRMDRAAFVAALGAVFEDSPWVAEAAWDKRPFADAGKARQQNGPGRHGRYRPVQIGAGIGRRRGHRP